MSTQHRNRKKRQFTFSDEAIVKLDLLVKTTGWAASRLIEAWILGAQIPTQHNRRGT